MSVVSIVLLGFGLADLVSASLPARARPVTVAAVIALWLVAGAYVLGLVSWQPWALGAVMLVLLGAWLVAEADSATNAGGGVVAPRRQLALVSGVVALSLILAGGFPDVGGPFARWFARLPLNVVQHVSPAQAALAVAAAVFMLHSTNRIIRLVLAVVGAEIEAGQNKLKGGRYIGPIERLIVAALILAGSLEGAGLIIAAKGFIRLPEIRSETEKKDGAGDSVAEYFLIGTLTSIAIAAALAALILAAY